MEEFTQAVSGALAGLNPVLMLCIAGGVALLFIGAILFDGYRRGQNKRRFGRSQRSGVGGTFRNIRSAYRSMFEELDRRKRREERERERRR